MRKRIYTGRLFFVSKNHTQKGDTNMKKTIKNLAITTTVLIAMYKAMECYEILMLANWKATLTFIGCTVILWAFLKANCTEEDF